MNIRAMIDFTRVLPRRSGATTLLGVVGACMALCGASYAATPALPAAASYTAAAAVAQSGTQTPAKDLDEAERERVRKMARDNAAKILKNIREQGSRPDELYVDPAEPIAIDIEQGPVINPEPTPAPTKPAGDVKGPHIVFDNPAHDFGLVMDKVELKCTFTFRNAGAEKLIIEKVNTGCGCTVANMPKQQFEPGESGSIEIVYNPKGTGAQSRQIQVITNDALQRVTNVSIAAHVLPVVEARPQTIQFGQVMTGQERKAELVIVSRDPNLSIESITTNGDDIKAELVEGRQPTQLIEAELPGRKVIEVTLSDDAAPGRVLKMITIKAKAAKADGQSEVHELRVNAFAHVKGELNVQPPFIRVKPLALHEEFRREAILAREGNKPFNITKVEVLNSTLENVTAEAEPAENGYRIVVKGSAGDKAKNFRGSVMVHTDLPREPTVEIQFSGLVRPPILPAAAD